MVVLCLSKCVITCLPTYIQDQISQNCFLFLESAGSWKSHGQTKTRDCIQEVLDGAVVIPVKVLTRALSSLRRLLDKYKVWERQQQQPADVGGMEDAEDSLTPAEKESTERTKNRIMKLVGLSAHTAGMLIA